METHFKKAYGAPISWETLYRIKPKNELETDKIGGMFREAHHPHSHFHIFASLPGLNGTATNRQRGRIY
jgi:arylamine N-acetyltransferase